MRATLTADTSISPHLRVVADGIERDDCLEANIITGEISTGYVVGETIPWIMAEARFPQGIPDDAFPYDNVTARRWRPDELRVEFGYGSGVVDLMEPTALETLCGLLINTQRALSRVSSR